LRSLESLPSNLPIERTTLIGRSRECAQVAELLLQRRVVTLTGVGGVGKTRLALHVGADTLDRYIDGVWLVALATVREPGMVPSAVAGVLGVPEQAGRSTTSVLIDAIGGRQMLLILDNCEHLLDASALLVDALLEVCPQLSILATSREALAVEGEQSWPTPSLRVPDTEEATFDEVAQAQAVELFVDRARGARPDFELTVENADVVVALCARLDGIPLAIELAAARVSALTPRDILDRIDQRFVLLTGGSRTALERHQTLQAAVAWSYDLLDPTERYLFDRLSVFAGGFTLAAAHVIAAEPGTSEIGVLDVLASLVKKSMVLADGSGPSARFRLLETLRQYARDRLAETDDMRSVREGHARYFLGLTESFEPGPEEDYWRAVFDSEVDNIRAAFDWFAEQGDAAMGLRCVTAMRGVFLDAAEALRRTGRAIELVYNVPSVERVEPLAIAASYSVTAGDYTRAAELANASITSAHDAGIPDHCMAYYSLGIVAFWHNKSEDGIRDLERAVELARAADTGTSRSRGGLIGSLMQLCFLLGQAGQSSRAIAVGEEVMEMARARRSRMVLNTARWNLAMACVAVDRDRAAKLIEECLRDDYDRTSTTRLWQLIAYAQIQLATGNHKAAIPTLHECFRVAQRLGDRSALPSALIALARALRRLDQPIEATRALGASEAQRELAGVPGGPADTRARERLDTHLRATLGDATFEAEYQAGEAFTRDELLAFASGAPIDAQEPAQRPQRPRHP
jgi:predicted ATPase